MTGSRDRGGSTDLPAVVSFELRTAGRATVGLVEGAAAAFGDRPLARRRLVHETVRLGGEHQDVHVELCDVQLLCERAAGERVGVFEQRGARRRERAGVLSSERVLLLAQEPTERQLR